jgi:hypothetical protein
MMVHFKKLKLKLHTNSKIVIWHQWRLYKRRKAAKAEKKKKALEAKSKKKGKYGGSIARKPVVTSTSLTPVKTGSAVTTTPVKTDKPNENFSSTTYNLNITTNSIIDSSALH